MKRTIYEDQKREPHDQKKVKTKVLVQHDVGFKNSLHIRGNGIPGLSWERGVLMKNVKNDEWVWETDVPFLSGEFKVLINDQIFELGENHVLLPGASLRIHPKFP